MLSRDQVRTIYDRFGVRQDEQAYYEDAAVDVLIAHAGFAQARRVFEFGCGTGRLAERLLEHELPPQGRYLGVDLSSTMVQLAARRLLPFGPRAVIARAEGFPGLPLADRSVDRFLSTYVFDLLAEDDIRRLLDEARRVLLPGGRLCLAGLGHGTTLRSRLVSGAWSLVHAVAPARVGGCRPLRLRPHLDRHWQIVYTTVVTPYAIPSEVVIATLSA